MAWVCKKGCTRFAAASDKVYQLLAHGQWFSPGTPASSTTKTGRHDIPEILLKVALKHQKSNQIIIFFLKQNNSAMRFRWHHKEHNNIDERSKTPTGMDLPSGQIIHNHKVNQERNLNSN